MGGRGNQPPPNVDQWKLREVTSELADEASEGRSDTSSVLKRSTLPRCVRANEGETGTVEPTGFGARPVAVFVAERQNAMGDRQPWLQPKETGRTSEQPKGKSKGKGGVKAKGKGKGLCLLPVRSIGRLARLCSSEGFVGDLTTRVA